MSRAEGQGDWTLHASGRFAASPQADSPQTLDSRDLRARLPQITEGREHYDRARTAGFEFGPSFQGLQRLWRDDRVALGEVALPESLRMMELTDSEFHPALLDACLQVVANFLPVGREPVVPLGISRVALYRRPGARLFSRVSLQGQIADSRAITADVTVFDESGARVAQIDGFACRPDVCGDACSRGRDV